MILFTILVLIGLGLIISVACALATGVISIILAFGDIFVCLLLIWIIIRLIRKRKE